MKNPQSLILLVPCQDRIVPEVDAALREMEALGVRVCRSFGQSAIDAARNRLATQALKTGFKSGARLIAHRGDYRPPAGDPQSDTPSRSNAMTIAILGSVV